MTLRTPDRGYADPLGGVIGSIIGDGSPSEVVAEGYITCSHWNPELMGWSLGERYWYGSNPLIPWEVLDQIGVVDSIEQFDEDFGQILRDSPHDLCVFFTHVAKNPGATGGWRWHKWGEYKGRSTPTREYLDDEPGFDDGVFTYHIYEVP